MRIPTYVSEGGISGTQLRTPQVAPTINLKNVIDGVESVYVDQENKRLEELKLFTETEVQRTGLNLDKKYAELQDKIKNGGSYVQAEKDFQTYYDKTVKESLSRLNQDPNIAQRASLQYERSGVEYGLRLKSLVRDRAKQDTIAGANERTSIYERQLFEAQTPEEQQAIVGKYSQMMSGLEASGIVSDGKSKVREFISNGAIQKIQFTSQTDPVGAFEMLQKSKDLIDVDKYIQLNGVVGKQAKDHLDNNSMKELTDDFYSGRPVLEPEQEVVDGQASDLSRQLQGDQITPEEFENTLSQAIATTGKIQTSVSNTVSTLFALSPDALNPQKASEVAMYSRIVSDAVDLNASLVSNRVGGVSEETRTMASLIAKKVRSGVDETTAVRDVLTKYNDPVFKEVYKSSRESVLKFNKGDFGKNNYEGFVETIMDKMDLTQSGATLVRDRVLDTYATARAMGSNHDDAIDNAIKQNSGIVGKFNGSEVMYPPHKVTTFTDEKMWTDVGKKIINDVYPELGKDVSPVLQGDWITERAIKKGKKSFEIPFRLSYKDAYGNAIPLTRKDEDGRDTGLPLYVTADPEMVPKKKSTKVPMGLR